MGAGGGKSGTSVSSAGVMAAFIAAYVTAYALTLLAAASIAELWVLIDPRSGTVPPTTGWDTPIIATNCTETQALAVGANGLGLIWGVSSATATTRCCRVEKTGTRITAWYEGYTRAPTGSVMSFPLLTLSRADGRIMSMGIAQLVAGDFTLYVSMWTDKDTISAARAAVTINIARLGVIAFRLDGSGGNVTASISLDGVVFETVYTAADATAYGTAGASTKAGFGFNTANATAVARIIVNKYEVTP